MNLADLIAEWRNTSYRYEDNDYANGYTAGMQQAAKALEEWLTNHVGAFMPPF